MSANEAPDRVVTDLIDEWTSQDESPQVAYRGGCRYVMTEQLMDFAGVRRCEQRLKQRGAYLISGGLGGIGLALARWLAEEYRARLVLVSRTALPEKSQWKAWLNDHPEEDPTSHKIRQLMACEQSGGEVFVLAGDVSDLEEMTELMGQVREHVGSLDGVFHAAGVTHDAYLGGKSADDFDATLRPKVQGAWVLDQVTSGESLDVMVLFSSVAGLLSSPGQSDYAAANRYLDSFAAWRETTGRPTMSIGWGLWGEVGMGVQVADTVRGGGVLEPMSTEAALRALAKAMCLDCAHVIVAARGPRSVLSSETTTSAHAPNARTADEKLASRESADAEEITRQQIEDFLVEQLAELLEIDPAVLDREKSLPELGLDSLLVVQLTRQLEAKMDRGLSYTLLRDYPTIAALSGYLFDELTGDDQRSKRER